MGQIGPDWWASSVERVEPVEPCTVVVLVAGVAVGVADADGDVVFVKCVGLYPDCIVPAEEPPDENS